LRYRRDPKQIDDGPIDDQSATLGSASYCR